LINLKKTPVIPKEILPLSIPMPRTDTPGSETMRSKWSMRCIIVGNNYLSEWRMEAKVHNFTWNDDESEFTREFNLKKQRGAEDLE